MAKIKERDFLDEEIEIERNIHHAIYQLFVADSEFSILRKQIDETKTAMLACCFEKKDEYGNLRKQLCRLRGALRQYVKDNDLFNRYRYEIRVLVDAAMDKVRTIFLQ